MKRLIIVCPHCGSRNLKKHPKSSARLKCNSCGDPIYKENIDIEEITGRLGFVRVLDD